MLITSDMPVTKKGSWFLNYKKDCDPHLIEAISSLVVEEYDIRNRIKTSGHISYMPSADSKRLGYSWHNCVPRLSFTRSTLLSIM